MPTPTIIAAPWSVSLWLEPHVDGRFNRGPQRPSPLRPVRVETRLIRQGQRVQPLANVRPAVPPYTSDQITCQFEVEQNSELGSLVCSVNLPEEAQNQLPYPR